MLSVKPVKVKCLFASATSTGLFWLVTALCLLGDALGDKGSVNSWTFDIVNANAHTYGPFAMVFLEGIQQAVIFGSLSGDIYVTTMTENNELSDCTVLEGVLYIHSAVAHPTDDNVVLVAGRAQSGGFTTFDMAFVGALFVEGANKYHWEMFDLVGEKYATYYQRMTCIEALPHSNVFVAAGNSDGAGEGNGMIFAVYDLDDFSKLYTMQHTSYYGYSSLRNAYPKAMARIGTTNEVLVVNWHNNGMCRFSVSRDTMQLKWCRYFTSEYYDETFVGIHVVNSGFLVTGYNSRLGDSVPFVRHFDMQGRDQICYLWKYADSTFTNVQVFTSFHDEANDIVYLGGSHKSYPFNQYSFHPLLVAYNASSRHLADVRMFKCPANVSSTRFCPKSIAGISKSNDGTLMFAMKPKYDSSPDYSVFLTMTHTNCLGSLADDYLQYYDGTIENTALTTEYFGEYTYTEVPDYDYDFVDSQTHWTKTLCGKKPNSAKDGNGKNGSNLGAIVGAVVCSLCVCIVCIVLAVKFHMCCFSKHKSGATQNTVTDTEAMVPSTTVAMATVSTVPVIATNSQSAAAPTVTYAPMAPSTPGMYTPATGNGYPMAEAPPSDETHVPIFEDDIYA